MSYSKSLKSLTISLKTKTEDFSMSGDDITLSEYIFNMCIFLVSFGTGSVLAMIIFCVMCAIAFSPFIIGGLSVIYLFDKLSEPISNIYKERIIKECIKIYCEIIELQRELNHIPYRENDFIHSVHNNSNRVCNLRQVKTNLLITRKKLTKMVSVKRRLKKKK